MDQTPDFVRYGAARAWSKELGVPFKALRERLTGLPQVMGRTSAGGRDFFYAEPDVRQACADLLDG
jgi:hypothetical protein